MRRHSRGISFMELLVVLTIMGALILIAMPRFAEHGDDSKKNACDVNQGNLELQAQLWFRNKGTWPAADLSDIGTDTSYLPDGLPTCPVDGSAYTFSSSTESITGHTH